ncbi:hypothetical protein ACWGLO_36165, partial [Streptomyces niveus]
TPQNNTDHPHHPHPSPRHRNENSTGQQSENAQKQRENALAEAAAFTARRREEADELRMELWLSAAPSRLIRTVAECAGLQPAQVLAQLAERIVVSEDGSVSVPPFSPNL